MSKFKFYSNIFIILIFILIKSILSLSNTNNEKIIISLTSDHKNLKYTIIIIKSILESNIEEYFYEIVLFLSDIEYEKISLLPKEIQLLLHENKIKIIFIKEILTNQRRILITMEKFKNNPILIINNLCKIPEGWLEMFIKDHIKYPNDAIVASIQYYFGKNYEIREFNEGFKGKNFGVFNHVSEMIFNFALINIDLGGILYPKNFFQNSLFYDHLLFQKSTYNSEDFWHSAFIIIEDKILRQSSRIFDFTKYLIDDINYEEYFKKKKLILEKSKISFLFYHYNFIDYINQRQNKIIVSIASYPERFVYLPGLITFIRNQTFKINKINFFFYEGHKQNFNLNLDNVQIHFVEKNLKPHLKYFYAMKLYRDHAIITLDDDLGFANDTFESLFNAYIENPNIINGRRGNLMAYDYNGELKRYLSWDIGQKKINESTFNLLLTNGAGSIFPPDILNINDDFLPIINETIICDDITLKYFATIKGIPHKWIINNHIMGIPRSLPKSNSSPLFKINKLNNDLCINKLNIMINKTIINNLCVPFRNLSTGMTIHLFDIHNQNVFGNKLYFDIYAFSYCPINSQIKFNIHFDNFSAYCFFNETKMAFFDNKYQRKNMQIFSCFMDILKNNFDLNNFFFPNATSQENLILKIYNYRTHITSIFVDFSCSKANNKCFLKVILYDKMEVSKFQIKINQKYYYCTLEEKYNFLKYKFPVILEFNCTYLESIYNDSKIFISGLPLNMIASKKARNNEFIANKFIIKRIVIKNNEKDKKIIIKGNLVDNLENSLYNFSIYFFYPNITLKCSLKPYSKYVQSIIFCINNLEYNISEFLIENQIVQISDVGNKLLLINEQTLIKLKFRRNDENLIQRKTEYSKLQREIKNPHIIILVNILIILLIIKIKRIKKKIYK